MAATTNKHQQLTQALALLKKKFAIPAEPAPRPVLEEVLYAILREGATTAQADAGFARLKEAFFDWNEVRVSTVPEVTEALADLPDAGPKAQRVISFLQEVFEERYSFDLSDIVKKGLKQAAKQLARYKGGATDFVVAWATQRALGGHALPLDAPTLKVLHRLGVIDDEQPEDLEAVRGSLEHIIPKAKGHEFVELFAEYAASRQAGGPDPLQGLMKPDEPPPAKTKKTEPKPKPR
jgi:endonuclease-3